MLTVTIGADKVSAPMSHTTNTFPYYISLEQAAELGDFHISEIQKAIYSGELAAAAPTGKGLRISRDNFVKWMSGESLPPWEGREGDWLEMPVSNLTDHIRHMPHPSDTYGAWVLSEDVLRIRFHRTEDKVEITTRIPNTNPGHRVEMFMLVGDAKVTCLLDVKEDHRNRRILTPFGYHTSEQLGPDERPNFKQFDFARIRAYLLTPVVMDGLLEVLKTLKVAKILGTDIAKEMGIENPTAGHFRQISESMQALEWRAKKTNRGLCYYAPGLEGQARYHFGG